MDSLYELWKDSSEGLSVPLRLFILKHKELKVNLKKTKVLVCGSKDEVLKSKVDPCAKCGKRVMANSVMCTKCGNGFMVDARK